MRINKTVSQKYKTTAHNNQNITSEESMSLVASSASSDSDQGSNQRSMSQTGQKEECPSRAWYKLYVLDTEFQRFLEILTGKKSIIIINKDRIREERTFRFKVFSYKEREHRMKDNAMADRSKMSDNGYIFISGQLEEIQLVLNNIFPRISLYTDTVTQRPVEISDKQMQEFIHLYEVMPYDLELMQHHIDAYDAMKHKKIRITAGPFNGKKGKILRIHRYHKLVIPFGSMTIALSNIHAFPYEVIDEA